MPFTISLMKRLLRSHFAETVAGLSGGLVSGDLPSQQAFACGWGRWLGLPRGAVAESGGGRGSGDLPGQQMFTGGWGKVAWFAVGSRGWAERWLGVWLLAQPANVCLWLGLLLGLARG